MIKIAVVDDQEAYSNLLAEKIEMYYRRRGIMHELKVFLKANQLMFNISDKLYFDIYFLDIEMPTMSGIELAKQIREFDKSGNIVFVTSHSKFAIDGYEVGAFEYILKDKINDRLDGVMNKLQQQMEYNNFDYYTICTNSRYEKINYKDIYYIYKEGKNSVLILTNESAKSRETLGNLYEKINHDIFIYIDRGVLVNIIHIAKYDCNEITLNSGKKLIVSRAHSKELKEKISQYWRKCL